MWAGEGYRAPQHEVGDINAAKGTVEKMPTDTRGVHLGGGAPSHCRLPRFAPRSPTAALKHVVLCLVRWVSSTSHSAATFVSWPCCMLFG